MLAVVGSLACGLREEPRPRAQSGPQDPGLPGIHDLELGHFAQQHTARIASGQGFVPLGIELEPGMPLRIEAKSTSGASAWGRARARAGEQAPDPLRAPGAVLLRLGATQIVTGACAVLRVSERVRPEIAVNSTASEDDLSFEVKLGWGEPSVPYRLQLDSAGLVPGEGQVVSLVQSRDGQGTHVLPALAPGTRVWVQPQVSANPGDETSNPNGASSRSRSAVWEGSTPAGRLYQVRRPMGLRVDMGGTLELRTSTRSEGQAPPRVEVFEPLGTRPELIPLQSMDLVKTQSLQIEPRRFVKMPVSVQAGDLVRVEVRGENRLQARQGAVHNVGVRGGLQEVPRALPNGERGWLVPGGRERGLYLKIGESVLELLGNDAIYAPEDGQVEVGVNQCFDGGDWPAYTECRRRLEGWELDLRVVVGVSSGA